MSLSLCLGPPQLWAGGPAPYLAVQHCFCCECFHVSWPAPLQPYSSQDHCWHGLALLAQDYRPFTRAATWNASPGTTLPLSTPNICHLTAPSPSHETPAPPGGHRRSWSGSRGAGQTLSTRLSHWPTWAPPWRRREWRRRRGRRRPEEEAVGPAACAAWHGWRGQQRGRRATARNQTPRSGDGSSWCAANFLTFLKKRIPRPPKADDDLFCPFVFLCGA